MTAEKKDIIAAAPAVKAQELNAAILQAVASGFHIKLEIEEREYSTPKNYKYPQVNVRIYNPHGKKSNK